MDREVRISPDGNMVAIRSDNPEEAHNAWMVGHGVHGGHWASTAELSDWEVMARQSAST